MEESNSPSKIYQLSLHNHVNPLSISPAIACSSILPMLRRVTTLERFYFQKVFIYANSYKFMYVHYCKVKYYCLDNSKLSLYNQTGFRMDLYMPHAVLAHSPQVLQSSHADHGHNFRKIYFFENHYIWKMNLIPSGHTGIYPSAPYVHDDPTPPGAFHFTTLKYIRMIFIQT